MSECRLLASNLIEISHAKNPERDLIAFRNRLYPKAHWLGRILTWFYKNAGKFLPVFKNQQQRLNQTIRQTRTNFFKKIEFLENSEKILNEGIKSALENKPESHSFLKAREEFLLFARFFSPLMKELRKAREEKVIDFLVPNIREIEVKASALKKLFHELQFYQKLFNFEEVTKNSLPLNILRKMSFDQQLTVKEEKKIKCWIKALEKSSKEKIFSFGGPMENSLVRVRFMHRMLYQIVNFINKYSKIDGKTAEVEILEARLVNLGYKIFEETDPRHIAYRNSLKPGDKIQWNGRELILGKILENAQNDPHYPIVFSVEDDPELEIVLYHNEAWSYLQRFQESILHCGVKAREVLGISQFGKVIVQERLYYPLNQIRWTSKGSEIGQKDFVLAEPIVELIRSLISRPFTPQPLLPEYFAFNYKGEMRAQDCFVPGFKNYTALENFAYEIAHGKERVFNAAVFSHLITASDLGETKEAKAYLELLEAALAGKNAEKSVSLNGTIADEKLLRRRGEFFDAIQSIYESCVEDISEKYQVSSDEQLRKIIAEELISYYKKRCPGSIIIPKLPEKVKLYTLMKLKLKLKEEPFNQVSKSIIQKVQQGERWLGDRKFFLAGIFNPSQIEQIKSQYS